MVSCGRLLDSNHSDSIQWICRNIPGNPGGRRHRIVQNIWADIGTTDSCAGRIDTLVQAVNPEGPLWRTDFGAASRKSMFDTLERCAVDIRPLIADEQTRVGKRHCRNLIVSTNDCFTAYAYPLSVLPNATAKPAASWGKRNGASIEVLAPCVAIGGSSSAGIRGAASLNRRLKAHVDVGTPLCRWRRR